ncbi:Cloroperoxidase [Hyaloscypha variabilis]|uniref:Cloroperoxidase n=1 Tax=Hyaloscypha variabilis (strain UAMH 11265 / GT02V1 / F) TaxID=1149755 RepID=A0A2J6R705_HYAVF|nr:Cloroperoxidase [Hyaloscypha variabilis F]
MKLSISIICSLGITTVLAQHNLSWTPPGPDDVRGPCPMLNTLANHGILPHSGYNISQEITIKALSSAVNFTSNLAEFLFAFALTTNPEQNATVFNLHQLGTHDILEHDASLSRSDKFFNTSDAFNKDVFAETTSYWPGDVIDLQKAATSRHARALTSVGKNPSFTFSELARGFAHGEVAALPLVFGDRVAGTAPKDLVVSFFENERLPVDLGWKTPALAIGNLDLCEMTQRVINASGATLEQAQEILPCIDFDA